MRGRVGRADLTAGYFAELTRRLYEQGLSQEHTAAVIAELADHAADSGTEPYAEFGPPADFARQLAPAAGGPADPDPGAERWVWTAVAYVDQAMMNRFGARGWEIERVDRLGWFVSRRNPCTSLRWEYRRDVVDRRNRSQHAASLAPDSWESCGYWLYLAYYKRPLAVTFGPAAALVKPADRPARSAYFTRRLYGYLAWLLVCLTAVILMPTVIVPAAGNSGLQHGLMVGMPTGAALGLLLGVWLLRRQRQQMRRAASPGTRTPRPLGQVDTPHRAARGPDEGRAPLIRLVDFVSRAGRQVG